MPTEILFVSLEGGGGPHLCWLSGLLAIIQEERKRNNSEVSGVKLNRVPNDSPPSHFHLLCEVRRWAIIGDL